MTTPINSVIRKVLRREGDAMNVFVLPYDGYFERNLCMTGHNIFVNTYSLKTKPSNLFVISDNPSVIPQFLDVDLVIVNDRLRQYDRGVRFRDFMHVPMLIVDHFHPQGLKKEELERVRVKTQCDISVSVDEDIQKSWGVQSEFAPYGVERQAPVQKDGSVLIYGKFPSGEHHLIKRMQDGDSNIIVRGPNPGLSLDCSDEDLLKLMSKASVYVNLTPDHHIPYNVMRAMMCGCAIISNKVEALNHILTPENSLRCSGMVEYQKAISSIEAEKLGAAARKYAETHFDLLESVKAWTHIFKLADERIFRK